MYSTTYIIYNYILKWSFFFRHLLFMSDRNESHYSYWRFHIFVIWQFDFLTRRSQGSNYPLKGGKDTLWEGGVRGVAFVHSNMIAKRGRVGHDMIDATDWLPTFYHLAGGDVTKIQDKIDGMNVWGTISQGAPSPRREVNVKPHREILELFLKQVKLSAQSPCLLSLLLIQIFLTFCGSTFVQIWKRVCMEL